MNEGWRLCMGCYTRKESAVRRGKRGTLCDDCFAEPEVEVKKEFIQVPIYDPRRDATVETVDPTAGETSATNEETKVSKTKTKRAKKPAKVKTAAKGPRGPSKISQAVEYMKGEVKKAGGTSKLEQGFRKELLERTAKKFGLKASTCATQYQAKVNK